jgi:hypothetical protein
LEVEEVLLLVVKAAENVKPVDRIEGLVTCASVSGDHQLVGFGIDHLQLSELVRLDPLRPEDVPCRFGQILLPQEFGELMCDVIKNSGPEHEDIPVSLVEVEVDVVLELGHFPLLGKSDGFELDLELRLLVDDFVQYPHKAEVIGSLLFGDVVDQVDQGLLVEPLLGVQNLGVGGKFDRYLFLLVDDLKLHSRHEVFDVLAGLQVPVLEFRDVQVEAGFRFLG